MKCEINYEMKYIINLNSYNNIISIIYNKIMI